MLKITEKKMGNNIVSSVIKVFDRGHMEIESISAKIDRDRINGNHEKHEVYVGNISMFDVKNHTFSFNRNQVDKNKNKNQIILCNGKQIIIIKTNDREKKNNSAIWFL